MIQKYNKLYLELFGELKPKMHIILHYVRIMKLYGPVIHFSANMFERKNRKLKEIALGTTCSVNLPTTIALRHQLQLCYSNEFSPLMMNDIILGPIENINLTSTFRRFAPYLPANSEVVTLKFIEVLGKKYREGTIMIVSYKNDLPQFAKVKTLYLVNSRVFLQVHNFEISYMNPHYHAYPAAYDTFQPDYLISDDFPRITPCLFATVNNQDFIATRYFV